MTEHERIWLEPAPGADEEYGRQWCQHNVWGDEGVEYVLSALSTRPAQEPVVVKPDMLRLAVAAVLEADKEFRAQMPPGWDGDPLTDELDGLRRVFETQPSLSSQRGEDRPQKPTDHVWVKCPSGHGAITHQHFDWCGCCSTCGAVMIECEAPANRDRGEGRTPSPVDRLATSDVIAKLQRLTTNTGRDWRSGEEFVHGAGTQDVVDTMRAALALLQGSPPASGSGVVDIVSLIKSYGEDALPDSEYRLACNDLIEALTDRVPASELVGQLLSALEDILPMAEEKWANPCAVSEIVFARGLLKNAGRLFASEGSTK